MFLIQFYFLPFSFTDIFFTVSVSGVWLRVTIPLRVGKSGLTADKIVKNVQHCVHLKNTDFFKHSIRYNHVAHFLKKTLTYFL